MSSTLMNVYTKENIDEMILEKFGLNQEDMSNFNFAVINKTEDNVEYIEYWILVNASYDYEVEKFVKINPDETSFGIQMQASGTYPGEHQIGYDGNTGINIWRNPPKSSVASVFPNYASDTTYDYTDFMGSNSYIGLKKRSNGEWCEFGLYAGWSNNLMTDSYGGVTIGGAGFEIDGNGVFPYTRLTSSTFIKDGTQYYLLGLLDNAYHPTTGGWDCDSNEHYSWFAGFISPHKSGSYLTKDLTQTKFVIMVNDNDGIDPTANDYDEHEIDIDSWTTIFEASATSLKAMVSGNLTTLGAGGSGGGSGFSGDYNDLNNKPTIPTAGSSTPSADVSGGAVGSSSNFAKADHQHPLSSAYATASHNQDLSTINNTSTVEITVTYTNNTTETFNIVKYTPPSS